MDELSSGLLSSRGVRALSSPIVVAWLLFLLSGPTPIHAPRPRPINYSVGVGTSDFVTASADASTQGGPPPLELSSFLQDLSLGAVSSPVMRASVSVLSPNFHRYLDASASSRSPPPPPRVTVDTAANAVVDCMDAAIDACVGTVDHAVQAVVETCTVCTEYCPPIETASVRRSSASLESSVDPPDDITVDGSLVASSEPDDLGPALEGGSAATSPMGPSLIDSDDEPIATRPPGYLNSFKTCEVSDQ